MKPPRARPAVLVGAAALCVGAVCLFWPGVVMYDSMIQFEQVRAGAYDDWHPPAMARLWSGLHAVFGGGAQPMLVVQMAPYWTGFGLIAAALARIGRGRTALAVLGVGLFPPFLGWQGVVLKDVQMLGALLAASGVIAWWRLRGERVPRAALVPALLLVGYATLVRANAVFATMPLLVLLIGPTRWRWRVPLVVGGVLAVLALAGPVNRGWLGATPSGVERTEAIYDLAGIGVRAPNVPVGLPRAALAAIAARHCVKPMFWDPLGAPERCDALTAPWRAQPTGALYALLGRAIVRAPLAYAAHRLAHLNATERWLIPAGWPATRPPSHSEPNRDGLESPGLPAQLWQDVAGSLAETPPGWPVMWVVVAATGFVSLHFPRPKEAGNASNLALALFGSALTLEASFAVVSIASDLRYHLWAMVATALGAVLVTSERGWSRRALLVGGVALTLVIASGIAARCLLPPPPASYLDQLL